MLLLQHQRRDEEDTERGTLVLYMSNLTPSVVAQSRLQGCAIQVQTPAPIWSAVYSVKV